MNKREARRWVRQHWQDFMRGADMPDLKGVVSEEDDLAIADVWNDECLRLADRLEPRVRDRSAEGGETRSGSTEGKSPAA